MTHTRGRSGLFPRGLKFFSRSAGPGVQHRMPVDRTKERIAERRSPAAGSPSRSASTAFGPVRSGVFLYELTNVQTQWFQLRQSGRHRCQVRHSAMVLPLSAVVSRRSRYAGQAREDSRWLDDPPLSREARPKTRGRVYTAHRSCRALAANAFDAGFQTSCSRCRARPSARSERASSKTVGQGGPAKPPSLQIFAPKLGGGCGCGHHSAVAGFRLQTPDYTCANSIPGHAKSFCRCKSRNQLT